MEKKKMIYLDCSEKEREFCELQIEEICQGKILLTDHIQEAHLVLCVKGEPGQEQEYDITMEAMHYGVELKYVTKKSLQNPEARKRLGKKLLQDKPYQRHRDHEYTR